MKTFKYLFTLFIVTAIALLALSPFERNGSEYCLETSIEITSAPSKAFEYLGNSDHASDWSVFVNHISPLNASVIKDGSLGSKRRCFRNPNEEGMIWDEEIIEYETNKLRTLTIYNLQGFIVSTPNLYTKQKYAPTDTGTQLTFGLYKKVHDTTWFDYLKIKLSGYYIKYIFKKNLRGIKNEIEHV